MYRGWSALARNGSAHKSDCRVSFSNTRAEADASICWQLLDSVAAWQDDSRIHAAIPSRFVVGYIQEMYSGQSLIRSWQNLGRFNSRRYNRALAREEVGGTLALQSTILLTRSIQQRTVLMQYLHRVQVLVQTTHIATREHSSEDSPAHSAAPKPPLSLLELSRPLSVPRSRSLSIYLSVCLSICLSLGYQRSEFKMKRFPSLCRP